MKLVGIAARAARNSDNDHIFQIHESLRRMLSNQKGIAQTLILPTENIDYLKLKAGTDSIDTAKLDFMLDQCDGFILPGGGRFYKFDEYIIRYAIKHDKPLLAICLGFQALCTTFARERTAFSMNHRIPDGSHCNKNATEYQHRVNITPNTKLAQILKQENIPVNSLHHYQINFEMDTLVKNAIAEDGVLEGVEHPTAKFILGTQWHPEGLHDENSERLIAAFVNALRSTNNPLH